METGKRKKRNIWKCIETLFKFYASNTLKFIIAHKFYSVYGNCVKT